MTRACPPRPVRASRPVIFRVAAGPRLGFGHLVRATRLADALGVRRLVSCRGGREAYAVAERLGCQLVHGTPAAVLADRRPALVLVDDPNGAHAARWCSAARRARTPVASIHDLGIGIGDADLVIDGSVTGNAWLRRRRTTLVGPRYAVIDPRCRGAAHHDRGDRDVATVLIALGGGSHAAAGHILASALLERQPGLRICVASGFGGGPSAATSDGVVWLPPLPSLLDELRACTIAIVGGGITAYEGCALGVPMIGVAVVPAQRPTVEALSAAGALVDGGRLPRGSRALADARAIAAKAIELLQSPCARARLAVAGRSVLDGRGAQRVATHLRVLLREIDRRVA